jgi:hypothetical protein
VVLRLHSVQVRIDDVEKPTTIATYWLLTDSIDRCRVGFLQAKDAKKEGAQEGNMMENWFVLVVVLMHCNLQYSSTSDGVWGNRFEFI